MVKKINIFVYTILGALLLLSFNNCEETSGPGPQSTIDSGSSQLSNGEGYSGVRYHSFNVQNSCFTDLNDPVSTVSIIDGEAFLTRDNCQDITPVPIDKDVVADHNKEVALYNNLLFDRSDYTASEILCRGDRIDDNTGYREVADIQIRVDSAGQFYSNIKLGVYDNNVLVNSAATDDYAVEKRIIEQQNGITIINYVPTTGSAQSGIHYLMAVRKDPNDGKLYSIISKFEPPEPGETPESIEDVIQIEMMECYMHEDFPGSGGTVVVPQQPTNSGPMPGPTPPPPPFAP